MSATYEEFMNEAISVVEKARNRGVKLRLLGSIAIRIHCPQYGHFLEKMGRVLSDIDFVASSNQGELADFLESAGYKRDKASYAVGTLPLTGSDERQFYRNMERGIDLDIFIDKLNFCHPIYLKDRLIKDFPTITIPDLLLGKMQIVEINEKDLKDLIVLLLEHDVADSDDKEIIDTSYICSLLRNDWGFYYTFNLNLDRLRNLLDYGKPIIKEQKEVIKSKLDTLKESVASTPKSIRWKLRAKIGTKLQWYQEVGEK